MTTTASIRERLDVARQDLLDLGLRNTLLNYRLTKSRGVQIVDARTEEALRWLVKEGRSLKLIPAKERDLLNVVPDSTDSAGTKPAFLTSHDEKSLQSRLLATYYAARTHIAERGVNILFVTIGMLHWFEDDSSEKEHKAPLVLIPVALERTSAREQFTVKYNQEDVEGNLSLATKLKADFGIDYPSLPDLEEIDIDLYLRNIARIVTDRPRWRVEADEMVIGFFSFAKFLMYRDLDPSSWCTKDNPDGTPILAGLLRDGFKGDSPTIPNDAYLDKVIAPNVLNQVVDVDSSQALAMLDVRSGRNLVIQGPPGTGKSQTITNLIADALGQGKRILFVAEKMAALEVVKRRLNKVGVGDACLELHSYSANKKAVLAELQRTVQLSKPRFDTVRWDLEHYKNARDQLNAFCLAVNTPVRESGLTPHNLMGELVGVARTQNGATLPRPSFEVSGDKEAIGQILSWNKGKIEQKQVYVANLQVHLGRMGIPSQHPFRAIRLGSLLPSDRQVIAEALQSATDTSKVLESAIKDLSGFLGITVRCDKADAEVLSRVARRALTAPHLRGVELRTGDWYAKRDQLKTLLEVGQRHTEIHRQYTKVLIPEAWDQGLLFARQILNTVGRKWWRWLSSDYRRVRGQIAGLCRLEHPKDVESQLKLVDVVMEAARLRRVANEHQALGATLYGVQWQGLNSDWPALKRLTDWIVTLYRDIGDGSLPSGIIDFLAGNPALDALKDKVSLVEAALSTCDRSLPVVFDRLAIDEASRQSISGQEISTQIAVFREMLNRLGDLQDAITFNNLKAVLVKEGLSWVVEAAWDWANAATLLVSFYRRTCFEAFLREAYAEREPLRVFEGTSQEATRDRFRDLDIMSLRATQLKLASQHWNNLPALNNNGQLGILLREFVKRSRHLPIRKLVEQAGNAIQAIKPVFMMSPMSIAVFVPPGSLSFDLVIFDEASQVKPVDAFGGILRGTQLVVVGDSKQLPPTSFFDALVGDDDVDEENANITSDIESVLGLAAGQGVPQRMLRWHYRSRHQSLIALSNQEFYDNRLVVFPSPIPAHRGLGLVFHHLRNTVYDRGKSRTNQKEAEMVAKAVMVHAKLSPELTLGVAAFSLQQAEAIMNHLEQMRRENPSLETFFSAHPYEPFFVKNLESVQGDERDVIFISIGYGRNEEGYITMHFGALNGNGGERRLNVLITRARLCCEVFTNLTHDDIDLNRTPARGVAVLKAFLKYAQTGITDIPDTGGEEEDSPFEREVAHSLRTAGQNVALQVGSGGFHIDLAVRDPQKPGRYLLGIECDGANYHSSRSARDRDRLRQQILENLGWQIHRIWSTDWFNNPERELKRTLQAIEEVRLRAAQPLVNLLTPESPAVTQPSPEVVVGTEPDPELIVQEINAAPYVVCNLRVTTGAIDLHEVLPNQYAKWIEQVVIIEGPVHKEDVARRIAEATGVKRIGKRIDTAFDAGVRAAIRNKLIARQGDFLWPVGLERPPVRDRSALSAVARKIELIAPEEIAEAILRIVEMSFGIDLNDVPQAVCRLFGFGRTSDEMTALVKSIVAKLGTTGRVEIEQGHITLGKGEGPNDRPPLRIVKSSES